MAAAASISTRGEENKIGKKRGRVTVLGAIKGNFALRRCRNTTVCTRIARRCRRRKSPPQKDPSS